ncbi:type II secretory pathway, component ExeA (predicted ATPase) [Gynuella sunshinyii YC6258]|uniref:Type II secretory pathway, component ExeA (Predicted ATPase) n=2 Tax=Gynuella sunshinyii TaxID=1445505 RepID=A0A0C5VSA2_9GAMM|nr:type II secretory pathway, component ExeA (predicted ATPase) [Gynuella sunshinyii YC6258]
MKIDAPDKQLEKELIQSAYKHVRDRKNLFTLIDEAHLLDMNTLRKLRLLFDKFPPKNNLILFGQPELLHQLVMQVNADLKSRVTYSANLLPLNDFDLEAFIQRELEIVKLGINTFDERAIEIILRHAQGNLRLCCHLCYGSLVEACRENKITVTIRHVNNVLIQPHWRSHEQLREMVREI